MIRVRVTMRVDLPDACGPHSEILQLEDGATVGTLFDRLCMRHETMASWRGRICIDRDGRELAPDTVLRDGDRIGIAPVPMTA